MSRRKLPLPDEVNRLLWIEEWTTQQIADHYGCTIAAVHQYMVAHGIKAVPRRRPAQCTEANCKKFVCSIKRWTKGKYVWGQTIRCYRHHQMDMRRIRREYMRRYRGYRGGNGRPLAGTTPSTWIRQ